MRRFLPFFSALALPLLTGCETLGGLDVPYGDLSRVDLVSAPSLKEAASWACDEWIGGGLCDVVGLGDRPSKADMTVSFDLVFELTNPSFALPVPLASMLLGVSVLDDQNLGAVCVSFCAPEDAECVVQSAAPETCAVDGTLGLDQPPSVEGLVDLATDATSGEANGLYRVLEPLSTTELHTQFDLGVDPLMALAEDLLVDAATSLIEGGSAQIRVPYTVQGDLLFNVTDLDRYAMPFGPTSGEWAFE